MRYRRTYALNNREKSQRGSNRERKECREINKEICKVRAIEKRGKIEKSKREKKYRDSTILAKVPPLILIG